jgi:hypothetical protein
MTAPLRVVDVFDPVQQSSFSAEEKSPSQRGAFATLGRFRS